MYQSIVVKAVWSKSELELYERFCVCHNVSDMESVTKSGLELSIQACKAFCEEADVVVSCFLVLDHQFDISQ